MTQRYNKKSEEEDRGNQWMERIQKSQVLHEAKMFSQSPIDANLCRQVIVELLYLLNQNEKLTIDEASDVFFGVTKLFQCPDPNLRRLVYLIISSLSQTSEDKFMVISSLVKDVTGNVSSYLFRANAIRVLANVIDSSLLSQIDRYIKQGVVSTDAFISSSALIAGIRLFPENADVIKR